MKTGNYGIVSYAGLDKRALLSAAGKLCVQSAAPSRFQSILALFPAELVVNMEYIGKAALDNPFAAPSGFSISPAEYHHQLLQEMPELYTGDNYSRNFDYEDRFQGTGRVHGRRDMGGQISAVQPIPGDRLVIT